MRASDHSADDVTLQALEQLITCLGASVDELQRAQARAEQLLADRRAGRPWLDLVTEEARPLVVESVSSVLSALAGAGHDWRREEAAALRREEVSINRIAALFGVTRQRISALLRESRDDPTA
ncbi:hypothetical protein [Blastococcus montanus]|uniref:hypothetical protein n=1 Tax=Blastococcus montanus TaxID=3144973 RepID=UPI0032082B5E